MSDVTCPRFFLLLHDQSKIELQRVERSSGSDGSDYYLAVSDPARIRNTCEQCQVLGAELQRRLAADLTEAERDGLRYLRSYHRGATMTQDFGDVRSRIRDGLAAIDKLLLEEP